MTDNLNLTPKQRDGILKKHESEIDKYKYTHAPDMGVNDMKDWLNENTVEEVDSKAFACPFCGADWDFNKVKKCYCGAVIQEKP